MLSEKSWTGVRVPFPPYLPSGGMEAGLVPQRSLPALLAKEKWFRHYHVESLLRAEGSCQLWDIARSRTLGRSVRRSGLVLARKKWYFFLQSGE